MNRTMSAILLGLLMVMMPLAGCVSDGTDGYPSKAQSLLKDPPGAMGQMVPLYTLLLLKVIKSAMEICKGQSTVSSDGAFQVCATMGWIC